jgi:hypothetical protein
MSDQPEGYMKVLDEELVKQKDRKDHEWVDLALEGKSSRMNQHETIKALCSMMNRGFKYMDKMQEEIDSLESQVELLKGVVYL